MRSQERRRDNQDLVGRGDHEAGDLRVRGRLGSGRMDAPVTREARRRSGDRVENRGSQ
jgi:hypothetical protein